MVHLYYGSMHDHRDLLKYFWLFSLTLLCALSMSYLLLQEPSVLGTVGAHPQCNGELAYWAASHHSSKQFVLGS